MSDEIFGIDLGTTYSAVARIDEYGKPVVIPNFEDQLTTPSVVYFESATNVAVGQIAKNTAISEPENVVSLIKRQMGTVYPLEFHGISHTPESVSALILEQLMQDARANSGVDTNRVVITVPAYFGVNEKDSTRKAGEIAGLDVVNIIAEPVAAALAYGVRQDEGVTKTIFVYDLGGGTFDTTILQIGPDALDVVVIDGDHQLGGADWDLAMFDLLVERFIEETGAGDDIVEDEAFSSNLALRAEDLKKALSKVESKAVPLNSGLHSGKPTITRREFEARTEDLLERTAHIVQRTLDAGTQKISNLSIDEVLLVGGSSMMPAVSRMLEERFGWTPKLSDPNQSVAKGAAIFGAQYGADSTGIGDANTGNGTSSPHGLPSPGSPRREIRTVIPKGVGIAFLREGSDDELYVSFPIHRNDRLPFDIDVPAVTVADGQTAVEIRLFEQAGEFESEWLEDNRELTPDGGAVIDGLPHLPKGSPIDIRLRVDEQGQAHLSAIEPSTGKSLNISVDLGAMQQVEVEQAKEVFRSIALTR